jgi:hypothetical protein
MRRSSLASYQALVSIQKLGLVGLEVRVALQDILIFNLKTCLQNERLTLLGLAVWKTECLRQVPSVVMDYYTIQQWMSSGWKACKPEQRASNATPIIVSAMRLFLE